MTAKLVPYVMSSDARAQAEFYKHSLGGEIHMIKTLGEVPGTAAEAKDKVMHLVMTVAGDNTLFMTDVAMQAEGSRIINLSLVFDDEALASDAFTKLGEGGKIQYPFDLQPWGAYYGEVVDQYGVTWQISKQ